MKTCSKCEITQDLSEFREIRGGKYLDSWCRGCNRNQSRLNYHLTKESRRDAKNAAARLRKIILHGISVDEYEQMLSKQGGVCAICGGVDDGKRLAIDHDHSCCPGEHSCGKCIRGLLCGMCNRGLGAFRDDPDRINKAIEYLRSRNG